ncbi:MAG: DASH complex subunit Duo1-domain-containing protein [Benjaminiella poitrasii]|nr:MAG: DASH complex subunit Duo1-domain-containing protein [Benjaminiella poitrasii]
MEDHNEEIVEASVALPHTAHRQSLLLTKSSRRSTILTRPQNQTEPPTENPNKSSEINDQLKKEYEAVKSINQVLESVLENFEETHDKFYQFSETVNQTDRLLDLWLSILKRTEDTKSIIEDITWLDSEKRSPSSFEPDHNMKKRRTKEI